MNFLKPSELFNSIMKKRKLLLDTSSKDISRYLAANNSPLDIIGVPDIKNNIPFIGTNENKIQSFYNNIDEPISAKEFIKSLGDITKASDDIIVVNDHKFINSFDRDGTLGSFVSAGTPPQTKWQSNIKHVAGEEYAGDFRFNNMFGESNKFTNPHLACFKLRSQKYGIKHSETNYSPILLNMIPAVEMSRCVPHLNVTIIDDSAASSNKISLSKFLVGKSAYAIDSFAQGLSNVTNNVFDDLSQMVHDRKGVGNYSKPQSISGMEIFSSPQTMVNAEINKFNESSSKVIDKFRPFMSIESISIEDYLLNFKFLSATNVQMSLKLHDRSRLSEIERLVAPESIGVVSIIIEFGWSHPDGSIVSRNPYGQFLDSLKRRNVYKITRSDINIQDDGTASINLGLISLGGDSVQANSISPKYVSIDRLSDFIDAFQTIIKENVNDTSLRKDIKRNVRLLDAGKRANDLVKIEYLNNINFFERANNILNRNNNLTLAYDIKNLIIDLLRLLNTSIDESEEIPKNQVETNTLSIDSNFGTTLESASDFREQIDTVAVELSEKSDDESLISYQKKEQSKKDTKKEFKISSSTDEFINDRMKILSTSEPDIVLGNVNPNISVNIINGKNKYNDADILAKRLQVAGLWYGINVNEYISIGKLVTCFCLLPMLNERKHDEIHASFFMTNKYAAAANNISLYDVFVPKLAYKNIFNDYVIRNNRSYLTVSEEIDIIDRLLQSDNLFTYGLTKVGSIESNNKKEKKVNTKTEEELQKEDLRTERLRKIYSVDNNFVERITDFKRIDLKVRFDTIPMSHLGRIKRILKISFYDNNNEIHDEESILLRSMNNSEIISIINSNNSFLNNSLINNTSIVRKFTSIFSKNSFFGFGKESINLQSLAANDQQVISDIQSRIANEIDSIVKSKMPTIEFGASSCNIENITLSSNDSGVAVEKRRYEYVTQNDNSQDINTKRKIEPLFINPATITVSMLGNPCMSIDQEFYVTAGTHTTLDNIYKVNSVNHSISQGEFKTTVNMTPVHSVSTKSVLNDLIKLAKFSQSKNLFL